MGPAKKFERKDLRFKYGRMLFWENKMFIESDKNGKKNQPPDPSPPTFILAA